jgi:hypothetical protein
MKENGRGPTQGIIEDRPLIYEAIYLIEYVPE